MRLLPQSLKELFYRTITGEMPLLDFEQWLYTSAEAEQLLSADDYLALLTLNYQKSGARYELVKLLKQHIDLGEFETHKLLKLLQEAILKTPRLPFPGKVLQLVLPGLLLSARPRIRLWAGGGCPLGREHGG
jgi:hypothetical protein